MAHIHAIPWRSDGEGHTPVATFKLCPGTDNIAVVPQTDVNLKMFIVSYLFAEEYRRRFEQHTTS